MGLSLGLYLGSARRTAPAVTPATVPGLALWYEPGDADAPNTRAGTFTDRSPAGHDAAAAGAARPLVVGGLGGANGKAWRSDSASVQVTQYAVSLDRQSFTAVAVMGLDRRGGYLDLPLARVAQCRLSQNGGPLDAAGCPTSGLFDSTAFVPTGLVLPQDGPFVLTVRSTPAGTEYAVTTAAGVTTTYAGAAQPAGASTYTELFQVNGVGLGLLGGAGVWSRAITDAELAAQRGYFASRIARGHDPAAPLLVAAGNSISLAYPTGQSPWPEQFGAAWPDWALWNDSYVGRDLAQIYAQRGDAVAQLAGRTGPMLVVLWEWTNSYSGGATGAQALALVRQCCAAYRAAMPGCKILVIDCLPRGTFDAAANQRRIDGQSLFAAASPTATADPYTFLAASGESFDARLALSSVPTLDTVGGGSGVWNSDGVHLDAGGQSLVDSHVRAAAGVLGLGPPPPADPLAALPGLVALARVGVDRAAGRLWQDAAKTVPAGSPGDPVRLETDAKGVDFAANDPLSRPQLGHADGVWYAEAADILAGLAAGVLPVGAGDYHFWAWVSVPAASSSYRSLCALSGGDGGQFCDLLTDASGGLLLYGAGFFNLDTAALPRDSFALVQCWRASGETFIASGSNAPHECGTGGESLTTTAFGVGRRSNGSYPGTRFASWGFRAAAPTADERALIYSVGPAGI